MKMLPAVAVQALELSRDPDCSIGQFAAIVERDVNLATNIIALSNSVMASTGKSIVSLHQAILRMGLHHCRNLILSSSIAALMEKMPLTEQKSREFLWRHGFLTGMISLHLNRVLRLGFHGEEMTAGLLHDIGRTLLAVSFPEEFSDVISMSRDESIATLVQEESAVGATHCEVGAWFAEQNSLPEVLIDVIRYHHAPHEAVASRLLVALTAASDHMAHHVDSTGDVASYDSSQAVQILKEAGVAGASQLNHQDLPALLEMAIRDTAVMTSK